MDLARGAVRSALKQKRLTVSVVLTLGIGIGLITIVFNLLNGYLWRSLPWPESDRLVSIGWEDPRRPPGRLAPVSPELASTLRQDATAFSRAGAVSGRETANLTVGESARPITIGSADAQFLDLLGARTALGRLFTDADVAAREPVVVLGHELWLDAFGADPGAVGETVRLDGEPFIVIGVLAAEFSWESEDAWRPLTDQSASVRILARLRVGVSREVARAELATLEPGLVPPRPELRLGLGMPVERAPATTVLWMLGLFIGATGFVVLIAGSNVTNLLLAAGAARRGERAVKLALGASGQRIISESLAESVVLGLASGIVGLFLALWGTELLVALVPNNMPGWIRFGVDLRVLAFAAGLGMLTAIVVGLAPARHARRADVLSLLRTSGLAGGDATRSARWRRFLIIGEIALSAALVTATLQAWRGAVALDEIDTGFDAVSVLSVRLTLSEGRYGSADGVAALHRALADRAARIPAVRATSIRGTGLAAFRETNDQRSTGPLRLRLEARASEVGLGPGADFDVDVVDTRFLETTGLPLLRGRFFEDRDAVGAPRVAVVSERLAQELWPGERALGRELRVDSGGAEWATVIGVVGDRVEIRGSPASMGPERRRSVYFHLGQAVPARIELLVRAPTDPIAIVPSLREQLRAIDPEQAIASAITLEEETLQGARVVLRVLGGSLAATGLTGMALALIGLYGLVSHRTTLRMREIGVRVALGATPRAIATDVLMDAAVLAGAGLAAGFVLMLAITRIARGLLFGFAIAGVDPVASTVTILVFSFITLAATWLPARRAMAADPLAAIRAL